MSRLADVLSCDVHGCGAPIDMVCACERCAREPNADERFHTCANPAHRSKVEHLHRDTRKRGTCWIALPRCDYGGVGAGARCGLHAQWACHCARCFDWVRHGCESARFFACSAEHRDSAELADHHQRARGGMKAAWRHHEEVPKALLAEVESVPSVAADDDDQDIIDPRIDAIARAPAIATELNVAGDQLVDLGDAARMAREIKRRRALQKTWDHVLATWGRRSLPQDQTEREMHKRLDAAFADRLALEELRYNQNIAALAAQRDQAIASEHLVEKARKHAWQTVADAYAVLRRRGGPMHEATLAGDIEVLMDNAEAAAEAAKALAAMTAERDRYRHAATRRDVRVAPASISDAFHKLWSSNVGAPHYDKSLWKHLDIWLSGGDDNEPPSTFVTPATAVPVWSIRPWLLTAGIKPGESCVDLEAGPHKGDHIRLGDLFYRVTGVLGERVRVSVDRPVMGSFNAGYNVTWVSPEDFAKGPAR